MNTNDPVRFSRLKLLGKSPAHYACPPAETGAMRKGSALHAYLLGQKHRVALYEGGRRDERTKAYQEFLAEHPGQLIVIPSEMVHIDGMRKSLESHARAMGLLDGIQEQTITWYLGDRACQGTPDVVHLRRDGTKTLVELKTCNTAAPGLFRWHAKNLAYHAQVAWYADGLDRTMAYAPGPVTEVFVVAVESTPPYPVTVFRACESILAKGRRQWRLWFETLRVCEQSGRFPGYVESDVDWEDEENDVALDWGDDGEEAA